MDEMNDLASRPFASNFGALSNIVKFRTFSKMSPGFTSFLCVISVLFKKLELEVHARNVSAYFGYNKLYVASFAVKNTNILKLARSFIA